MHTQLNGFIVLQVLMGGGSFQPVFAEDENLMFFKDTLSANHEIDDAIQGVAEAIEGGHMSKDSRMTKDDYLVVPATITDPWKDEAYQTIVCFIDGEVKMMQRRDDDWHDAALAYS